MDPEYGIHPAHDAMVNANRLHRAVRRLANDAPDGTDLVGLSLAANVLYSVADALDRHWEITRPGIEAEMGESQ